MFSNFRKNEENEMKIGIFFHAALLALLAGCTTLPDVEVPAPESELNEVLARIEKATYPQGKPENIKSMSMVAAMSLEEQEIHIRSRHWCKYPDQSRAELQMPGQPPTIMIINGKRGWKIVEGLGITELDREEVMAELLSIRESNPSLGMRQCYARLVLDSKLHDVRGNSCRRIVAYPPDWMNFPPVEWFFDTKTFLARRYIKILKGTFGSMKIQADILEYKLVDGIMVDTSSILKTPIFSLRMKVLNYKFNAEIPDSLFFPPGEEEQLRREFRSEEILDQMFEKVAQYHPDPEFASKNRKYCERRRKQILAARNDTELALQLNKLLEDFGDSHMTLLPPLRDSAAEAEKVLSAPDGGAADTDAGIDVVESDGKVLVLRVRKGSPAEKAGVKPGMEILEIGNLPLLPSDPPNHRRWAILAPDLLSRTAKDGKIKLRARTKKEVFLFEFAPVPSEKSSTLLGNILLRGGYYSELRPDQIAYIHFTVFSSDIMKKVRLDILGKFKDARGLILDLRGNVGGTLDSIGWLAGWTTPQKIRFGTMAFKGGEIRLVSSPQTQCFKGPLAVIIDNNSYSSAEIFAAGIQDAGAGRIFGTRSAGQCLPSTVIRLKYGFRLQTVAGDERRESGKRIEKQGVTPDTIASADAEGLLHGDDIPVERAADCLLRKK